MQSIVEFTDAHDNRFDSHFKKDKIHDKEYMRKNRELKDLKHLNLRQTQFMDKVMKAQSMRHMNKFVDTKTSRSHKHKKKSL